MATTAESQTDVRKRVESLPVERLEELKELFLSRVGEMAGFYKRKFVSEARLPTMFVVWAGHRLGQGPSR